MPNLPHQYLCELNISFIYYFAFFSLWFCTTLYLTLISFLYKQFDFENVFKSFPSRCWKFPLALFLYSFFFYLKVKFLSYFSSRFILFFLNKILKCFLYFILIALPPYSFFPAFFKFILFCFILLENRSLYFAEG